MEDYVSTVMGKLQDQMKAFSLPLPACLSSLYLLITGTHGRLLTHRLWQGVTSLCCPHTLSTAFWHLPPDSARMGYATEGALFITVQLSAGAVIALRKLWALIRLRKHRSSEAHA